MVVASVPETESEQSVKAVPPGTLSAAPETTVSVGKALPEGCAEKPPPSVAVPEEMVSAAESASVMGGRVQPFAMVSEAPSWIVMPAKGGRSAVTGATPAPMMVTTLLLGTDPPAQPAGSLRSVTVVELKT